MNSWQTKKLGEVCEIITGGTPKTSTKDFYGDEFLWAGPSDLNQGVFVTNTNKKLSKKGFWESGIRIVPKDSVMMSCIGYIGKVGIAPEEMATNQQINTFVPNQKILDSKYLYYSLISKAEEFQANSSQTTLPIINKTKCSNIEIPLPPLEEQKEIVKMLDEKMGKIGEAKHLRAEALANIGKILPATLHEIFEEGKKNGWEEDILENVVKKVADGTHDTPKYCSDGIPLITSKNLLEDGLDFSNIKYISEEDHRQISKRSGVENGDLLIAMIGTIGNIVEVKTDRNFSIKNVGLIKPNDEKVLGKYIAYFLHNSRLSSLIERKGATQKFIALGPIRNIKIKFPPLAEQQTIVKKLDTLSEKLRTLRDLQTTQLADLKSLEKAYLREAFSGNA